VQFEDKHFWLVDSIQDMDKGEIAVGSAKVNKGESLLIVGPSGTGKTSLLRAIAGLWSSGSGRITRCPLWFNLNIPDITPAYQQM
jgi:ABC-type uncharacterized transport system fused permease/ATPase subunit